MSRKFPLEAWPAISGFPRAGFIGISGIGTIYLISFSSTGTMKLPKSLRRMQNFNPWTRRPGFEELPKLLLTMIWFDLKSASDSGL